MQVTDGGATVEVTGAAATVILRLLRLEPSLRLLSAWDARISVAGESVKVYATQPVHPPLAE